MLKSIQSFGMSVEVNCNFGVITAMEDDDIIGVPRIHVAGLLSR